ncbi:MAG: Glycosyltransferase [Parcubacteria group bacterium GW2011_GWF2_38_76]|nr:MAG: Glycosyltransferase [Parcubacteria group bacterium GW2011_GWF2_38_76]HBM45576.1 hypothetical protein [Patescibacteria group bacterium]
MDKITKGINVLMIGSDMEILHPNSDSWKRMKEYGSLVNRLDIVIFNGNFRGGNEDDVYQVSDNVFAHPRSFLGLLGLFKVSPRKLSFVLNHKIDLVTTQDPFVLGLIGRRLAKWLRAGFQVQIHTDFMSPYFRKESFYNRIKVYIAKSVLKSATGIRVVSSRIFDSIKGLRLKVKPIILPIWTDVSAIKNSPISVDLKKKYPQFKKIFLMASRITIEKNIFLAIHAMRHVLKDRSEIGLIIVGSGPFRKLAEGLVRGEGLQKSIIFEDWSDHLSSYYKTCDVFLNTSNYEGYGRTIVEALSVGTPVITTDVGVSEQLIKNDQNGIVVPVGSKKELEIAMLKIANDDSYLSELKDGAKNIIFEMGNRDEYLEKYARSWEESIK